MFHHEKGFRISQINIIFTSRKEKILYVVNKEYDVNGFVGILPASES